MYTQICTLASLSHYIYVAVHHLHGYYIQKKKYLLLNLSLKEYLTQKEEYTYHLH